MNNNGTVYQAVVWPGPAVFPDWFAQSTRGFWTKEFGLFFNESGGLDIDALWIDMNEPSNFCPWPCDDPAGFTRDSGWINHPPPPSRKHSERPSIPGFPDDFQPRLSALKETDIRGSKKGLPGRDLINPKYQIYNFWGPISSSTADTDLIHSNGLAEYDTHNL
jgi:alpha-glucosidase